ncbi:type IV secretory system conjugative DNA transfer family protein [Kineosporia babensis]|uniref:Type IV secretory system conjugative DNA transfer family protein n=1 Tax=Kineosporia babensis TaxID=499548 RepID=A0A9X1NLZ4_9ACTN|nr:type IV secretory system conjugative DNA transfer family protein [Kineosporia babensis]MCD5316171.1 type IV secretory system conjugative DNA transfer family protein [Kineosporia babensis]
MAGIGGSTDRATAKASSIGNDRVTVGRGLLDGPGDYLLAGLLALVASVGVGTWLWGQLAGLLFSARWLDISIGQSITIAADLPGHWSDPRQAWPESAREHLPGLFGMLICAVLVLAGLGVGLRLVLRRSGRSRQVRGFASPGQLEALLSPQAALAKASWLRPGLTGKLIEAADVMVDLGRAGGRQVATAIDVSVLLLAAARSGKSSQIVIPWLRSWPGPALVTSVRTDVVKATLAIRRERGPVAVMDLSGTRWPETLRWSPVEGCEEFDVARRRADTMVQVGKSGDGGGMSDSTNAGFFGATATNLLAGWLHTAALTGRTMDDVLTWALDEHLDEPVRLLRDQPKAAMGVAAMMHGIYRAPMETRSNMWTTAMTSVAPLLSATAREVFSSGAGRSFNIEEFLRREGTIYLVVPKHEAAGLAPLISGFVDEITQTANALGSRTPSGRLDPPLGMFLDEVANISPLPHLPSLMSWSAGSGIFVLAVLQEIAQARAGWGRNGSDMLWGSATVKIALGGLSGDELADFSKLCGHYRETLVTTQRSATGTTTHTSLSDRSVLSAENIRTLSTEDREALIVHTSIPPVLTRMQRHYESPHAHEYAHSVTDTARQLAALNPGYPMPDDETRLAPPASRLTSVRRVLPSFRRAR